MTDSTDLRLTRIGLNNGSGRMPALGCGTLISDVNETIAVTKNALAAGFRHFDCAERYQNEREVGEALQVGLADGGIERKDIFVLQNCGIRTIDPNVSNQPSKLVWKN